MFNNTEMDNIKKPSTPTTPQINQLVELKT